MEVRFNRPLDLIDHALSAVVSKVDAEWQGQVFFPKCCDLPLI